MLGVIVEKKALLFLLPGLVLLFALAGAFAVENVAELKIESITTPVRGGETLRFSFQVGNKQGPPCPALIEYWFEKNSERLLQGKDTVYLETGGTKAESASLIMPPDLEGIRNFYLQMQCNDATVLASRVIHIGRGIPQLPLFKALDVSLEEGGQSSFSYKLEAGPGETVPVYVKEQIVQDSNIVWTNAQEIAVSESTEINRLGPLLPAGNYKLTVTAGYAGETAKIAREFTVKPAAVPAQPAGPQAWVVGAALALLFAATFGAAIYFSRHTGKVFGPVLAAGRGKAAAAKLEERMCPVEAEASGVLDSYSLHTLLDEAGLKGRRMEKAAGFAERTEARQLVRACILTDRRKKMRCETTVRMTLSNNTNRNWKKVVVLAEVPEFLAEKTSEIEADCEMQQIEGTGIVRFLLPKVGAMQSASLTYKAAKMISQAEANSIPLPAVISYRLGKPLVITQVRVEKGGKEAEAGASEEEGKRKAARKAVQRNAKKGKS